MDAFGRCVNRVYDATFRRHLAVDGDTELDTARKKRAVLLGTLAIFSSLAEYPYFFAPSSTYYRAGFAAWLLPGIVLLAHLARTKRVPLLLLEGVYYMWVASIMLFGYLYAKLGARARWPFAVLLLDLSLVNQLPRRVTTSILLATSTWIVVMDLFEVMDVSLPDTVHVPHFCDCDSPSCRLPQNTRALMAMQDVSVLMLDFYLTRGFAYQVEEEKAAMQLTIDTFVEVSTRLADYDVDGVAALLLQRRDALPSGVASALHALELNLRIYQPYLPDALFETSREPRQNEPPVSPSKQDTCVAPPPGVDTSHATIAFTDIRASTAIWEAVPDEMRRAMRVHNSTIRSVINACSGYEVKTIGDAFMVAFDHSVSGVNFALRIHTQLLRAAWPAGLSEVPICAPHGGEWGGLTVRVGVNTGPVVSEHNRLTNRTDYFGHTVNVAARLEGACTPGAVALRCELWEEVQWGADPAVAGPTLETSLKGMQHSVSLRCVWPAALQQRRSAPLQPAARWRASRARADGAQQQPLQAAHATVGVVQIRTDEVAALGPHLSHLVDELSVQLTRSSGLLVSVVGSSLVAGWNVARPLKAHAEGAMRFARAACGVQCCMGLASGEVHHGSIGSASQRFVTVTGGPVLAAWALSMAACEASAPCLYAWLDAGADGLPTSLKDHCFQRSRAPYVAQAVYEMDVVSKVE